MKRANLTGIQAVVFDMDGLMFNTEDIYDRVGTHLLQKRNRQFSIELKRKMMGRPNRSALQIMKDNCLLEDSVEDLLQESDSLFLELLRQNIQMLPGLNDLLAWLEQKNIAKAVATSSSRKLAHAALGHFNLIPRFKFVLTGDDVSQGKPHPEIYLAAANRLNISANQMLVLEDSINGSIAAVAAGAETVVIPGPHSVDGDFCHVKHSVMALDSPIIKDLLLR